MQYAAVSKGVIHIGISRAQQLDTERHHEAMIKMQTSDKAREWFKRKPYEIKRGDSGGQENTKSISSISEGNTKDKK